MPPLASAPATEEVAAGREAQPAAAVGWARVRALAEEQRARLLAADQDMGRECAPPSLACLPCPAPWLLRRGPCARFACDPRQSRLSLGDCHTGLLMNIEARPG